MNSRRGHFLPAMGTVAIFPRPAPGIGALSDDHLLHAPDGSVWTACDVDLRATPSIVGTLDLWSTI